MRDSDRIMEAQKYFTDATHPVDFAIAMRRYMHAMVILQTNSDIDWLSDELRDGYYHLSEFVETIDPLLTLQKSLTTS